MLDGREHNLPIGTICIEDIEIGMTRSLSKTIGDREIEMFAELSTDHNPVHLDDAYARDTIFGGRIAHGMLTAGLISAVIGEQLPGHGTVYLGQSLKFMAPVRPGRPGGGGRIGHGHRPRSPPRDARLRLPRRRDGRAQGRGARAGAEPQVRLRRARLRARPSGAAGTPARARRAARDGCAGLTSRHRAGRSVTRIDL